MKEFTVHQIHLLEKRGCVTVEAESRYEAIKKARSMEWEDFEQREVLDQTQWKLGNPCSMSFFERLSFLFAGGNN
tara:strand:+ start:428 stop:652 length:225 start_codon:yes stop_codon:yes gene_type:complete